MHDLSLLSSIRQSPQKKQKRSNSDLLMVGMLNGMSDNFSEDIEVLRTKADFFFIRGNFNFDLFFFN